jgi:hypothetical protein
VDQGEGAPEVASPFIWHHLGVNSGSIPGCKGKSLPAWLRNASVQFWVATAIFAPPVGEWRFAAAAFVKRIQLANARVDVATSNLPPVRSWLRPRLASCLACHAHASNDRRICGRARRASCASTLPFFEREIAELERLILSQLHDLVDRFWWPRRGGPPKPGIRAV